MFNVDLNIRSCTYITFIIILYMYLINEWKLCDKAICLPLTVRYRQELLSSHQPIYIPTAIYETTENPNMAEVLTTISPITNAPIHQRDAASPSHLAACASAAQAAFRTFSRTVTLAQRKEIVTKFADGLEAHKEALGREITEQMGRPVRYTPVEVATGARRARYLASLVDKVIEDTPGEPEEGFRRFVKKEPIGVVLVLFPWNVGFQRRTRTALDGTLIVDLWTSIPT